MSSLPRLAVGGIEPAADCRAIQWALLDALEQQGAGIQSFLSRAYPVCIDGATTITGVYPRHLDSWLMTPVQCREAFLRAAWDRDLSVVEGCFAAVGEAEADESEPGGRLDTLCQWLALPRLGVLDVVDLKDCRLPAHRPPVEALLLDRISGPAEFFQLQTIVESLWGISVLGGLEALPALRGAVSELVPGRHPSRELCRELGNQLLRYTKASRLFELADRHDFPAMALERTLASHSNNGHGADGAPQAGESPERPPLTVAVAYDDAFNGYFPDTLDALERQGITVRDFSPLRDECPPPDSDVLYIGCGHPDLYAEALSANHCLMASLREHLCAGRKIYAEGGGLAYLCQHLELPNGESVPMVGMLPAVARRNPQRIRPRPVELTLAVDTWLGETGDRIRGYLNENWLLDPTGPLHRCAQESEHRLDLIGRHHAIGSRLHLNFAVQPALLDRLLQPTPAAPDWALTR